MNLSFIGVGRSKIYLAREPAGSFLQSCPNPWLTYCQPKKLQLDIPQVVESLEKKTLVFKEATQKRFWPPLWCLKGVGVL